MNRDKVMKWVKALESGRYRQGRGTLRRKRGDAERFCCLGVAAKINRANHSSRTAQLVGNDQGNVELEILAKELGVTNKRQTRLIDLNDGDRWSGKKPHSFKYIAKWIRRNILKEKGIVLKEEE